MYNNYRSVRSLCRVEWWIKVSIGMCIKQIISYCNLYKLASYNKDKIDKYTFCFPDTFFVREKV